MKTAIDRRAVSIVKARQFKKRPILSTPVEKRPCGTVRKMIEESLDLIGGLKSIIGDAETVVVKPNLVEIPFETTGGSVVTDPRVLEAVVLILKDHGVDRVLVAEGRSVNLKHIRSGPEKGI